MSVGLRPLDTTITPLELGAVTLLMVVASPTLDIPRLVSYTALHDGWMAVPVAGAFGFVVLTLVSVLASRFPGQTLVQYAPHVLGRVAGRVVSALFIFTMFFELTVLIREFSDFVLVVSLPKTPISVVAAFIVVVAVVGARSGVEGLARVSFLLTPIAISVIVAVLGFGTVKMKAINLEPPLQYGAWLPLRASIESDHFFGITGSLALLYPFVRNGVKARRAAVVSLVVAVLILTVATVGVNAVFSNLSGRFPYPLFSFARVASTGPVSFRMDAFVVALEFLGLSMQVAIWLFMTNYGLSQWFGLSNDRPSLIPLALIGVALGLGMYATRTDLTDWMAYILPLVTLTSDFGIPALLLGVTLARGLRGEATRRADQPQAS